MKLVATVKDSDYGYIETFIRFLGMIVDIIDNLFGNLVTRLGELMSITNKDE